MTEANIRPPLGFMAAAGLAILWALAGVYACYTQLTLSADQLAALPTAQREAFTAMPQAIRLAYVVAVTGGSVGAVLLILRRRQARIAFIVSLIGVVVQFGWVFGVFHGVARLGPSALAFPAFIVAATVGEIWLAGLGLKRGWLR